MCHRIAIGTFYAKVYGRCVMKSFITFCFGLNSWLKLLHQLHSYLYWLIIQINIIFISCFRNFEFSVILLMLLLQHMDVESNPGPRLGELSIFHLNIRSVRHKLDYIEDIVDEYDIVCLTETHLDDQVTTNDLCIDGFHSPFRLDRNFAGVVFWFL